MQASRSGPIASSLKARHRAWNHQDHQLSSRPGEEHAVLPCFSLDHQTGRKIITIQDLDSRGPTKMRSIIKLNLDVPFLLTVPESGTSRPLLGRRGLEMYFRV